MIVTHMTHVTRMAHMIHAADTTSFTPRDLGGLVFSAILAAILQNTVNTATSNPGAGGSLILLFTAPLYINPQAPPHTRSMSSQLTFNLTIMASPVMSLPYEVVVVYSELPHSTQVS